MKKVVGALIGVILAGGWVGTAGAGVNLFHGMQSNLEMTVILLFSGGMVGLVDYRRKKRMS